MDKNKDKEGLQSEFVALFLSMLDYSNDKEFKKLLIKYKYNREELKEQISKLYLKYLKDNELKISYKDVVKEIKKLESRLKKIGYDLKEQEDVMLNLLLHKVFRDSYRKVNDILNMYVEQSNINEVEEAVIDKVINTKIDNKDVSNRNKDNKEKLINRVKNSIKNDLIVGKNIDVILKDIDKGFNSGVNISDGLISNEIARVFNGALIEGYKNNKINKVMWNSQLEENTCGECREMDGRVFSIDEAPVIPLHNHCKCFYTAVLE